MPLWRPMPPVPVTATLDSSGFNAGNWTNHYTSAALKGLTAGRFELYHAAISVAAVGSGFTLGFDLLNTWGGSSIGAGGVTEYSPAAGWLLTPSREFYFFWNYAASGTPPQVCCWFRFDAEDPANRQVVTL